MTWDAEHAPENLGLSHNVLARTSRQGEQVVVEAILQVQSVDLVADPATTRGLFESQSAEEPAAADTPGEPAEVAALERELGLVRRQLAAAERQASIRRLLEDQRLPSWEDSSTTARAILSPLFREALASAGDEQAVRRLIEDRAQLVAHLTPGHSAVEGVGRPQSREQRLGGSGTVSERDLGGFVRAITGR